MAKYLIQASYTAEGLQGLREDKASGRQKVISNTCAALGGKLDALFYSFGHDDVVCIIDLPDNRAATALALAVNERGMVRVRTTPLLTVEEVDQALDQRVDYSPPGEAKD